MVDPGDADVAGEGWRNALAALEYAERHGSPTAELDLLATRVTEARVAMFQAAVAGNRALPAYPQVVVLP